MEDLGVPSVPRGGYQAHICITNKRLALSNKINQVKISFSEDWSIKLVELQFRCLNYFYFDTVASYKSDYGSGGLT